MRRLERELVEVVLDGLDLTVVANLVAETEERVLDLPPHLRDRVELPQRKLVAGKGHVDHVLRQSAVELLSRDSCSGPLLRVFEAGANAVQEATAVAVANVAQRLR